MELFYNASHKNKWITKSHFEKEKKKSKFDTSYVTTVA